MEYKEKMQSSLHTSGMSIVEISIVIMIIGLFMAGAVGLMNYVESAKATTTDTHLINLKTAIERYVQDSKGQYPDKLEDLLVKPASWKEGTRYKGPYVDSEKEFEDGWNLRIQYKKLSAGNRKFELFSWGSKEGEETPAEKRLSVWEI